MIFQEPLTRLNPLMRISEHFEETLRDARAAASASDEIEQRSLEALRLMGIPPDPVPRVPARVLRRHAAAADDRARAGAAARRSSSPTSPTTALDVLVEAQIIRILHDLRDEFDTSLLLITHNLGIIAEACDRVAVMYAGRIVEIGDARTVFRDRRSTPTPGSCCARRSRSRPPAWTTSRVPRRTWSTRRRAAASTRGARTPCRCARSRDPEDHQLPNGSRSGLLGRRPDARPGRADRGRAGTARAGGDLRCRRSLRQPRTSTGLDAVVVADDLVVSFDLQGGAFSRGFWASHSRTVKAVDGVDLTLRRGEVLGLVGESGSGKTTLGRALLGLVPRPAGASPTGVATGAREVVSELGGRRLRALRTSLQMVFQDPHAALNPSMTIETAVGHPLVIHRKLQGAELRRGSARRSRGSGSPRPSSSCRSTPPTSPAARSSARSSPGRSSSSPRCWSPTSRCRCST